MEVSRTAANIKIKSQAETFKLIVSSQFSMYILLGAVVFVAPQLSSKLGGAALAKTTTALMFVVGACFGLVQSIPVLLTANAAADRIVQLEATLQAHLAKIPREREIKMPKRFDKIEMQNIVFRYVDKFSDTTFQIGPLDFTLNSGDLVFVTGGNGSGKSTFMKVLAGLYPPDSGEIMLDGMRINDETRDAYRALISGIFFDNHLFRRLYGIPEPEPGEAGAAAGEIPPGGQDRPGGRRIPHARPVRRPAPAARAHRQHAGEAPDPAARRMDRGAGSRIPPQILSRTAAGNAASRRDHRGDHAR